MDAVEDIKQRLSIEDVIADYVELKRAGRNYKALSPFSAEKTPSFVVSPEKQIWHDFSSNRGGDMFTFIQEVEATDFKGAMEILARKAGIDLDQYRTSQSGRGPNKERLHELLELAARFYQVQFGGSKLALEYIFKRRAFTRETALTWRLGYAPNTGRALVDHATKKGFTKKELEQAGLVNRYGSDLFKARLMVPLCDAQGRVIGFTARILVDDPSAPKYMNTPATPLYDKSRHIFGLHHAKEMIRKSKFVLLAEGNLDVIASHQAGTRQCVATAGTALTEYQLKALGRFTPDVRLCFDADKAGIAATERALPIASKVGVNLSVVTIPDGKDPDELIRQDPTAWLNIIEKPKYAPDWLIARHSQLVDLKSAQGKRSFSDTILAMVRGLSDSVEREHYVQEVAKITESSPQAVREKLTSDQSASVKRLKTSKSTSQPVNKNLLERTKAQDRLLALLLLQPKLRDIAQEVESDYLVDDEARQLMEFIKENPDFAGDPKQAKALLPLANRVKIISLQYEELYQDLDLLELRYEAIRQQSFMVEQYVKNEKEIIRSKLDDASEEQARQLLVKVKHLDELLRKYKGAR